MSQKYIIETDNIRDVLAFNESKKLLIILNDLLFGLKDGLIKIYQETASNSTELERNRFVKFFKGADNLFKSIRERAEALKYDKDGGRTNQDILYPEEIRQCEIERRLKDASRTQES